MFATFSSKCISQFYWHTLGPLESDSMTLSIYADMIPSYQAAER